MATINPNECSIFIQVWVDTNALQNGSMNGVYLVDNNLNNNLNNGSGSEGTSSLVTNVTTNAKICWSILNTNLNSKVQLSFSNFSNASVFGASGTPQAYDDTTWTGQAEANGHAPYSITFNAQEPGKAGISTTVTPTLYVHS
jgi:hypothetical protein